MSVHMLMVTAGVEDTEECMLCLLCLFYNTITSSCLIANKFIYVYDGVCTRTRISGQICIFVGVISGEKDFKSRS